MENKKQNFAFILKFQFLLQGLVKANPSSKQLTLNRYKT